MTIVSRVWKRLHICLALLHKVFVSKKWVQLSAAQLAKGWKESVTWHFCSAHHDMWRTQWYIATRTHTRATDDSLAHHPPAPHKTVGLLNDFASTTPTLTYTYAWSSIHVNAFWFWWRSGSKTHTQWAMGVTCRNRYASRIIDAMML